VFILSTDIMAQSVQVKFGQVVAIVILLYVKQALVLVNGMLKRASLGQNLSI
jgi:hypothetical protein